MNVLREAEWHEIEIGEVFATDGCWNILYKVGSDTCILLADDYSSYPHVAPGEKHSHLSDIYKLPKSVQRLWIGTGK